jgi:hypothetical protein
LAVKANSELATSLAYEASQLASNVMNDFEPSYSPTPVLDFVSQLAGQEEDHLELMAEHGDMAKELARQATTPITGSIEPLNAPLLLEASQAHLEAAQAHRNAADEITSALPVDYYRYEDADIDEDRALDDIRLDQDESRALSNAQGAIQVARTASDRAMEATRRANSLV